MEKDRVFRGKISIRLFVRVFSIKICFPTQTWAKPDGFRFPCKIGSLEVLGHLVVSWTSDLAALKFEEKLFPLLLFQAGFLRFIGKVVQYPELSSSSNAGCSIYMGLYYLVHP